MIHKNSIAAITLMAALCAAANVASALDETKYPDWKGQWTAVRVAGVPGQPSFDPNKFEGLGQQAPLIQEYQAILEASVADQRAGGPGNDRDYACFQPGMPRMMNVYSPMEIIVTPDTTYFWFDNNRDMRRIYTDGRDWNQDIEPSFAGYSIGKWIDADGDRRYDALEIETRGFRGPRSFDSAGLPLHQDNQTIVKERIFGDKANQNILHDEVTVIDNALTRPWSVTKSYRRAQQARPVWFQSSCVEGNTYVRIGEETYMQSADGHLMPMKKDQPPPDLRYFDQSKK